MQESQDWPLGREDPMEKRVATHSSILAWRIPWTERGAWWATVLGAAESHMTEWLTHTHTHTHTHTDLCPTRLATQGPWLQWSRCGCGGGGAGGWGQPCSGGCVSSLLLENFEFQVRGDGGSPRGRHTARCQLLAPASPGLFYRRRLLTL